MEPASNLQVLEVASKSLRLSWEPSVGEATGYKVQMIPMTAAEDGSSRRQELYVGPGQTSLVVRDLSPDVEYQVNLFALKGLTPSEPLTVLQKTQPIKVSLGEELPILLLLLRLSYYLSSSSSWSTSTSSSISTCSC